MITLKYLLEYILKENVAMYKTKQIVFISSNWIDRRHVDIKVCDKLKEKATVKFLLWHLLK